MEKRKYNSLPLHIPSEKELGEIQGVMREIQEITHLAHWRNVAEGLGIYLKKLREK